MFLIAFINFLRIRRKFRSLFKKEKCTMSVLYQPINENGKLSTKYFWYVQVKSWWKAFCWFLLDVATDKRAFLFYSIIVTPGYVEKEKMEYLLYEKIPNGMKIKKEGQQHVEKI